MKSNLRLYTSYVTEENVTGAIKNDILPIFILRNIRNSVVIGKYSKTAAHFFQLAPSDLLYRRWRDGEIELEEYKKLYTIEMATGVDFQKTIENLEFLASVSNARGVVLMGYGKDRNNCHRSVLADILNHSGLLEYNVEEIEL